MKKAFTLIEILVVLSLFSIVVMIGVPLSQSNLVQSELETAVEVSVSSIRIAESYSRSGKYDSEWGVNFQNNRVIVYKGNVFATREQQYDIETVFSDKITFTGLSEVSFSKIRGIPANTGSIFINTPYGDHTISINTFGGLNY